MLSKISIGSFRHIFLIFYTLSIHQYNNKGSDSHPTHPLALRNIASFLSSSEPIIRDLLLGGTHRWLREGDDALGEDELGGLSSLHNEMSHLDTYLSDNSS